MAFDPINSTEIEVGKPVKAETQTKVKGNFDDHETRIAAQETVSAKIEIVNSLIINLGQYTSGDTLDQIILYYPDQDLNIITAEVRVIDAGTSGVMEYDLRKGPNLTTLVSVFSTKPSLDFSAGSDVVSTNAVFSDNELDNGQVLVLDITQVQLGIGRVHIRVTGEPR